MNWSALLNGLGLPAVISAIVAALVAHRLQRRGQFQSKIHDLMFAAYRENWTGIIECHKARCELLSSAIDAVESGLATAPTERWLDAISQPQFVGSLLEFERNLLTPEILQSALHDYSGGMFIVEKTSLELAEQGFFDEARAHFRYHSNQPLVRFASEIRHVLGVEDFLLKSSADTRQLGEKLSDMLKRQSPASSVGTQEYYGAMALAEAQVRRHSANQDEPGNPRAEH